MHDDLLLTSDAPAFANAAKVMRPDQGEALAQHARRRMEVTEPLDPLGREARLLLKLADRCLLHGRAIALVAAIMAWNDSKTILALVAFAWAGFGASFGPTILLSLYWKRLSVMGAFAGMITGAVVCLLYTSPSPRD